MTLVLMVSQLFLDVSDMIQYNVDVLNRNDLENSFFHLDRQDPTGGFAYDATKFHGNTFPSEPDRSTVWQGTDSLYIKLLVASHLAGYLRRQLEHQRGYTATVGISTCKVLSKLVGNVHKPSNQTTLIPPYDMREGSESNVVRFLDAYEIRRIPGIGAKLAHSLKDHLINSNPGLRPSDSAPSADDKITVRDVRLFPGMGPALLEKVLGGPGSPKGIGIRIWNLIHGVDDSEVLEARDFPTQISIEDSYRQLDTFEEVKRELIALSTSLIRRMRIDLTEKAEEGQASEWRKERNPDSRTRWLAHPRTLRLSTRPRAPPGASGVRAYSISRASRSAPLPQYVFNLGESVDALGERLVQDLVISMFRKLHPERSGWNLSLLNIAVTNVVESAGEQKRSSGRDIKGMFQRQETVLKEWRVSDPGAGQLDSEPLIDEEDNKWDESDDDEAIPGVICRVCGVSIPHFAQVAHEVYHSAPD